MSNRPWFYYYNQCANPACDWIKYRNRPYTRGPTCPKCRGQMMHSGAVHGKCKNWHPENTPCPSPYDVPLPPAKQYPDGSCGPPDCYQYVKYVWLPGPEYGYKT